MEKYTEIEGDLIYFAKHDYFDVIAHGCNCFCTMGAGLAPQMAEAFGCDKYALEDEKYRGNILKLGTIQWQAIPIGDHILNVVNAYTQYMYGQNHLDGEARPLDYHALQLCLKKMNHIFKGKRVGLPQIGCHLAGGDWVKVKAIIQKELRDCFVTIVFYKPMM